MTATDHPAGPGQCCCGAPSPVVGHEQTAQHRGVPRKENIHVRPRDAGEKCEHVRLPRRCVTRRPTRPPECLCVLRREFGCTSCTAVSTIRNRDGVS